MSPKKVRLVTDAVKGMDVETALSRLAFLPKKSAPAIAKLIRSASANALHNNQLEMKDLRIKNIIVNEGIPLKRWQPAAFGSAHPFKHRASHVNLILTLKDSAAKELEKKTAKADEKAKKAEDKKVKKETAVAESKAVEKPKKTKAAAPAKADKPKRAKAATKKS